MSKVPCKQCPFRKGSAFGYDADSSAALDDGDTPACHMKVGLDSVFTHAPLDPPAEYECIGHTRWTEDHPDFDLPVRVIAKETHEGTHNRESTSTQVPCT